MNFIGQLINRRKALIFLIIILIFQGFSAYKTIPREEYPDVQIPIIFISLNYEGISPEDAERLLLKPSETELQSIETIKNFTSYSIEGKASIILEFEAGFDSKKAMEDVKDKMDIAKSKLPKDIEEPIIKEIIFSEFPILNLIISGNSNEKILVDTATDLKDSLETLPNILDVNIAGDIEETIEIIIDPIKLESYNISTELIENLIKNNQLVTAGALISDSSRYAIKIPGLIESLEDIANIPIKKNDKSILKFQDIAEIKYGYKPRSSIARVNGKKAVTLEISKRSGKNVIETVSSIKKLVDSKIDFLPENIEISYSQDSSKRIINTNDDLQNNIIFAIILVLLTLLLTVGLRPAILTALSIPLSFVIAILILKNIGVTLNVVVLFSLILSVGLIVDSAIVITEYADRKLKDNLDPKKAYAQAVHRMYMPIIISTLTTLIVFMPLLFWPGVVGQFMYYIPLTLIITLSSSLLVALIFIPVIGSWFKGDNHDNMQNSSLTKLLNLYENLLIKILNHPKKFSLLIFIILISSIIVFKNYGNGIEFFPNIEPDNASIQIRARGNLSIYEKNKLSKKIEDYIIKNHPNGIKVLYARAGSNSSNMQNNNPSDTISVLQIQFSNWRYRPKAKEILEVIKQDLNQNFSGIIIETAAEKKGPQSGKDIQLEITSSNPQIIEIEAKKLTSFLKSNAAFTDIEDSTQLPSIEWKFNIDKELAEYSNVSINEIGNFIKLVTNGLIATNYRPDNKDDEVDIVIRFPEKYRNLSQFDLLKIIKKDEKNIPISNFINIESRQELNKIERSNSKRVIYVKANMSNNILPNEGVKIIKNWLEKQGLNKKIQINFKGEDEDSRETQIFLKSAFILAILAIALVLIIQFNSFYKMFIILSAAYLSTTGVLLALLIANSAFGIVMCGLGIISLAGIVVNNNIIFIDSFDKIIKTEKDIKKAIINTAKLRVRPILLTSITTVLGLLPMVYSMNINFFTRDIYFNAPSSQWWQQLSTTIASGLSFATILTLFLTPALLLIGHNCKSLKLNLWQKLKK
jgi:multidrug efflux pump